MEFNSHPLESSSYKSIFKVESWGKDQLLRSLNKQYEYQLIDDRNWYWITSDTLPARGKVVIRLSRELDLTVFSDSEGCHSDTCANLIAKFNTFVSPAETASVT
jgi:hypothetical protein